MSPAMYVTECTEVQWYIPTLAAGQSDGGVLF
jgi:hypothetical protein